MRIMLHRMAVAPFECAIAVLILVSGVAQVFGWGTADPVNILLPAWEVYLLSAMLLLCGFLVLLGIGLDHVATEAVGLVLLMGSLLARLVLYNVYLGTNSTFVLTGTLDLVFILAAISRLSTIRRARVVIELRKNGRRA